MLDDGVVVVMVALALAVVGAVRQCVVGAAVAVGMGVRGVSRMGRQLVVVVLVVAGRVVAVVAV